MKIITLCLYSLLFSWSLFAQPVFKSAISLPSAGHIAMNNEQLFQAGYYFDPVDFDQDGIPDVINRGGSDIFLANYTKDGSFNWVGTAGGNQQHFTHPSFGPRPNDYPSGIVIDDAGDIYVAGTFDEAADFDGDDIDDVTALPPDTAGIFIAKYTNTGAFEWASKIEGVSGFPGKLVFVPSQQALYLTATKYDDPTSSSTFTSNYLIKTDLAGNVLNVHEIEPATEETSIIEINDMNADAEGNMYLTGLYKGTVDFDGDGPSPTYDTFPGPFGLGRSSFVAKYSSEGAFQWVVSSIDSGDSWGEALAVDESGNIHVSGNFGSGEILFVGDNNSFSGIAGPSNIYFLKISEDGIVLTASFPVDLDFGVFGFMSQMYSFDITVDDNEAAIISGSVYGIIDLDEDGIADIDAINGAVYLVSYSSDGEFEWFWQNDSSVSIFSIENLGGNMFNMYGTFSGSFDFDGPDGIDPVTNPNIESPGFALAQFELFSDPLPVELTSFNAIADGNDALLSWATASESNNAGFEILQSTIPNTSVRAIQESPLPPNSLNRAAFIPGNGTTDEPQSYTHQIKNLPPGAHHFQIKQIDFDGTFELSQQISLQIGLQSAYQLTSAFPNPFNPQATFSLSLAQDQEIEIALFDLLGRQVQSIYKGNLTANTAHQFTIDGSDLPSGTYIYQIRGDNFLKSEKIILSK